MLGCGVRQDSLDAEVDPGPFGRRDAAVDELVEGRVRRRVRNRRRPMAKDTLVYHLNGFTRHRGKGASEFSGAKKNSDHSANEKKRTLLTTGHVR